MPAPIQAAMRRVFLAVETVFDRAFGPRANPLHHLGAISYWLFWIIVASGFYLYAFYETGVEATYASVERLSREQWFAGGLMRSVHRYASDALVVTMLLHLVRHFAFDRYRGFRAFSWITGVVLLWFAYVSGINGFMLPWDRLGQYVATATAEWLDALPVFRGALVRNFVLPENVTDRFFSLLSFLHIGIPLAMLAALWVHTQRVPQARTLPPKPLMAGTALTMLALAVVRPVIGQGPAEAGSVATTLSFDWFYLTVYPLLLKMPPIQLWLLVGGATALMVLAPWLPPRRRRRGEPVRVIFHPGDVAVEVRDGETLLDAGLRRGLALPFECRSGGCGVCKATVVGGEVDPGPARTDALTPEERARGRVLMCCATPLGELSIELDDGQRPLAGVETYDARVERLDRLAPDVIGLALRLQGGRRIEYLAGQYLNVVLPAGERRSYSFTTASGSTDLVELQVRRIPGGRFSTMLFESIRPGDALRVEGPFGDFVLREPSDRPVVFVAGATGFAPVKSLLEEAFRRGARRPMHLYWGVRTRADLYAAELAGRWAREHPNFRFVPVLSEPAPGDRWDGRTGLVHEAILADFPDLSGHEVYACGSLRMVQAARPAFVAQGLAEDACHSDAFTEVPPSAAAAAGPVGSGGAAATPGAAG
jgi:NAD(P)H-flavin reductase/ferredoxin/quinol-cytochrome oxidoreductase complex cytochrome b subunit